MLTRVDLAIVMGYFAVMVGLGLWVRKKAAAGIESYFLGGRRLPWWLLGLSGGASWFDVAGLMFLTTLLLDVGVTGLHPFEVAAGMDVVKVGKEYPRLQIWGGIDKRALAKGPAAIDAELDRVLPPMKERGGYAAGLDHNIPSDVSLANHRHYTRRLAELSYL